MVEPKNPDFWNSTCEKIRIKEKPRNPGSWKSTYGKTRFFLSGHPHSYIDHIEPYRVSTFKLDVSSRFIDSERKVSPLLDTVALASSSRLIEFRALIVSSSGEEQDVGMERPRGRTSWHVFNLIKWTDKLGHQEFFKRVPEIHISRHITVSPYSFLASSLEENNGCVKN